MFQAEHCHEILSMSETCQDYKATMPPPIKRDEFVLVFDGESMNINRRCTEGPSPFQLEVPSIKACKPLYEGEEVFIPPNPSPGIQNGAERTFVLERYRNRPLLLDVHLDSVEGSCCSRHFMGFGFSKHVPYYFPGSFYDDPICNNMILMHCHPGNIMSPPSLPDA